MRGYNSNFDLMPARLTASEIRNIVYAITRYERHFAPVDIYAQLLYCFWLSIRA